MTKRAKRIEPEMYDHPRQSCAMLKTQGPIKYRIQQIHEGKLWTSSEEFTAPDSANLMLAIKAGFLFGEARWAIDQDGLIMGGYDAQGNSYYAPQWPQFSHTNLESIRSWHAENGKVW